MAEVSLLGSGWLGCGVCIYLTILTCSFGSRTHQESLPSADKVQVKMSTSLSRAANRWELLVEAGIDLDFSRSRKIGAARVTRCESSLISDVVWVS